MDGSTATMNEGATAPVVHATEGEQAGPPVADTQPADRKITHFAFHHKVFDVPGAVFKMDRVAHTVALHFQLGGIAASLDANRIRNTFGIAGDSADGQMLATVEQALRFVREVRPGDKIPNELLDGTASWAVEPQHYERARSKILLQLVRWLTNGNSSVDVNVDVLSLIESLEVKNKIADAFRAAARALGIKEGDEEIITSMIAQLSNELAYIEALRDKSAGYLIIRRKLKELAAVYHDDRRIAETIDSVSRLTAQPFTHLREQFQLVDAQTAEVLSSLRQLAATVQFVRRVRDEVREFLLLWGDLDIAWLALHVERNPDSEAVIARTYRFAATHYSMSQRWALNVH